ncbi:isoamylase early set domain-containing protein [Teredinibacter sp. KSP-S5-2]|uniref:isoamylase early set domain-containing protein n=1 Tax=Teredinibacter sp. KSP-S5-2 TaxID=3034506 RepID=UPI0029351E12|nr:isoamylase early set domain-containing protein [Teredinibacter sp. KSP-S5-2]WNO08456.1 isoamylase early set domain-containing protein [Teredinibacter sp. KSP-S5-2]
MSIKKQFLKSRPVCKVKFTVPKDQVSEANKVCIVGEFNDWDTSATEMTRLKSGAFTATLELDKDKDHQFRYLVDENYWINEEDADGFVPSNIGSEQNCVISL